MYQTSDFDYELPKELIAQHPLEQRTASRLLVLNKKTGIIEHKQFVDLLNYLKAGDLLVFNNSKVIKARLFGQKPTGGKVELLIERVVNDKQILAHVKSSKSPKTEIILDNDAKLKVMGRHDDLFVLDVLGDTTIWDIMNEIGHIPLPPYIERADDIADINRYQTVYAKHDGSVAAPTAGLHFDEIILDKIKKKGVDIDYVMLHVGAGTFQPVRVDDINDHIMHSEYINVSKELCEKINLAKKNGGRIIAVGTTSVRSLETAAQSGQIKPFCGDTDIFIYPGYKFKIVDAMITNFHLPQSTLLMLISAFAKMDKIKKAYSEAIAQKYRFFSYGDAMMIL